jgi:hypothetical protein
VQTAADANAGKRFLFDETLANLREHGHKRRGPLDTRASCVGKATVFDVA